MTYRTVAEWLEHLGAQTRELRLRADLTQQQLAHNADVSTTTIHHLESGAGTSLSTFVKVIRALGREDWLEELATPVSVSPMQLLRERQGGGEPARQRASGRPLG